MILMYAFLSFFQIVYAFSFYKHNAISMVRKIYQTN